MMKLQDTKLNQGGVMRCCIETWGTSDNNLEVEEGHILKCKYCKSSMILENGIYKWNKEENKENGS